MLTAPWFPFEYYSLYTFSFVTLHIYNFFLFTNSVFKYLAVSAAMTNSSRGRGETELPHQQPFQHLRLAFLMILCPWVSRWHYCQEDLGK